MLSSLRTHWCDPRIPRQQRHGNALLYPCSLVSPSWSTICIRYLTEGTKIRLYPHLRESDPFYAHLDGYPLHSIRNIVIFIQPIHEEDEEDLSEFNRHLQSLIEIAEQVRGKTNMKTLALVMDFSTSLLTHQHHCAILQDSFSHIVRLDVDLRTETSSSLIIFVSSFHELEILFITCEALRDDPNGEPLDHVVDLPSHLHTLHLNITVFHGHAADELCEWLSNQTPLSSLKHLSILNCDSASGPEERVPIYLSLNDALSSLYLSIPSDDMDPLTYLDEEPSGYEYDLSHLSVLESLSIHIPDSRMNTSASLPQLDLILHRLMRALESVSSTRLEKFNLIIGRNNLSTVVSPESESESESTWDKLDRLISTDQFAFVRKEVFVPVSGCDSSAKMMYAQRALHLFPRCEEQDGLVVNLLERYQRTGSNMLEEDTI